MSPKEVPEKKGQSFSMYLLVFMVVLVVFIVGLLTANYYFYAKNTFDQESAYMQVQTEKNVEEAMRLTDTAANILDNSMNDRMLAGLNEVNNEYERVGRNPARMDLDLIKTKLGEGFDIYVINESGVIVETTYAPELGQDFRQVPYFYKYLTTIRLSEGFFPDRVVHEFLGSGQFRKYAYMPTADHRYVLELGLASPSFDQMNTELDDHNNIAGIILSDPYAEQYQIFNTMGRSVDNNSLPDDQVEGYLQQVIQSRQDLVVPDPEHSRTTHYLFIDLENAKYGSDPSRIVEISYDTGLIQDALDRLLVFHVLFAVAAIALGCALAFLVSRRLTRPIAGIAEDANKIACGDLEHRIGTPQIREFIVLEQSINMMVDSLKGAIRNFKDGEKFQNEMIDNLPIAVFIKRADTGRYIYWNKTSEELFHVAAAQAIGKTDRDLFPAEVVSAIEDEDRRVLVSGKDGQKQIVSRKYMRGRIIRTIIVPVFDSGGAPQYILGISEDISPGNINLKMDLLFSITRHDILENLSVIVNQLERAQLKNTHDEVQQLFDKTIGSIETIRNQIAFMRALQEVGLISPKWQSVSRTFYEMAELLPGNNLDISADMENIEIFADPLLPRVFYNLLEHSLKRGGTRHAKIRLSAEMDDDALSLVYQDESNGSPAEEKEKIFDPGYTTGISHDLFLIRELLSFTGIKITETGEPGKGERFEILVPPGRFRFIK
ncbi:MAG: PAS domain-containing protein [Methanoregula sp.]|uniref:PAS domain-containing protein n=1 Tax=Methanoregula sp. TaxID=2052170 RepID=UPI003D104F5A